MTPPPAAGPRVRAVSYNIHAGMGLEHALRTSRADVEHHLRAIARHIVGAAPAGTPVDVVALNEVDFGSRRSDWLDQARFLADALGELTGHPYDVVEGVTIDGGPWGFERRYGNALLTRHPVRDVTVCLLDDDAPCAGASPEEASLPSLSPAGLAGMLRERRGVVKATVELPHGPVDVLVTHLEAVVQAQREAEAAHLVARFVDPERPTLVLGDVNAVPAHRTATRAYFRTDRTHDILTSTLVDARMVVAARAGARDLGPWATWPADRPRWSLDAALATPHLVVDRFETVGGTESDHLGLLATFARADARGLEGGRALHTAFRQRQLERILTCDAPASEQTVATKGRWLTGLAGFSGLATTTPGIPTPPATKGVSSATDSSALTGER